MKESLLSLSMIPPTLSYSPGLEAAKHPEV